MGKSMDNFIVTYGTAARAAAAGTPIFPETILCAAALESGYAKSELSNRHYNFFGIKAQKNDGWKGQTVEYKTKEQDKQGNVFYVTAKFRVYNSPEESFKNYVKFIQGPRYIKAGVTAAKSPVEQFEKIHAAGYATDKKYSTLLKSIFNGVKDWVAAYPAAGGGIVTAVAIVAAFFF